MIARQHLARRSESPSARRLAMSGTVPGWELANDGYIDRTRSAIRYAAAVDICCAITMRRRPQMGSSVGVLGQRLASEEIICANVWSRLESSCSGLGEFISEYVLPLLRTFVSRSSVPFPPEPPCSGYSDPNEPLVSKALPLCCSELQDALQNHRTRQM
jgi:hypothetical protein